MVFHKIIRPRTVMDKDASNREKSLLTSKLHTELKKKKKNRCYVCIIALYNSRDLDRKKTGAEVFEELRNVVLDEN